MTATYPLPPLFSGGIMLTWHCTNACRHCLYRCTTAHAPTFMRESEIDATFATLAKEPSLSGVHLAGGEATVNWERLKYALESARRHGVRIDYLETNGGWCTDRAVAEEGFETLRRHGLGAVLISASLFHNEFIPLRVTQTAITAANHIFNGNVIVWTPDVLNRMERALDPDRTHTLKESCEALGIDPKGEAVWQLHSYLTPGGRAAEALNSGLPRFRPEEFEGDTCRSTLSSTSHFHLDPEGNLYTGLCPGIAPGNLKDLHPTVSRDCFPITHALMEGGPCALKARCCPEYTADEVGYISKCHYCLDLRKQLYRTGEYPELRGKGFYEPNYE
ncbi:MAG: radical SAM protein [Planctomycetota bacterium]|jgi:hypothetical protein